jgi:histidine triad (HIT) family protein
MNCPFCKINKNKTKILRTYKNSFVVLSNPRIIPGHILIIPKRHVEKLSELIEIEKKELLNIIIEFQEKILLKISPGCDIRINYHPFQKQGRLKVDHLHIHLIPRSLYDELFRKVQIKENNLFTKMNKQEMEKSAYLFS